MPPAPERYPLRAGTADTLAPDVREAYDRGRPILLFAYSQAIQSSEAYADWAAYLNEFKTDSSGDFHFQRIKAKDMVSAIPAISGLTEFSIFLKREKPIYLYNDLIVEPQVYTAVERVYLGKKLTAVDDAFLPTEIEFRANTMAE